MVRNMENELDKQLEDLMKVAPEKLVFLCGAGISLDQPTALPTVNHFICSVLEKCEMKEEVIGSVCQQFGKLIYRFESLVDEIRKHCDDDLMLTKLFNSSSYNKLHYFLAMMLDKGASVITTNFDNCIENACDKNELLYKGRLVFYGQDMQSSMLNDLCGMLIKIHGSHPWKEEVASELVITIGALAKTQRAFALFPELKKYILELIQDKIIVVMGYSCSDDFDVVPLLSEASLEKVVWLDFDIRNRYPIYSKEISNANVKKLSKKIPISFFRGQLMGFVEKWGQCCKNILLEGERVENFSVNDYLEIKFPCLQEREVLCNEILLAYGLYEEVMNSYNLPKTLLQKIKAEFRLNNYDEVVDSCTQILKYNISVNTKKESMYYLSSAYYYKNNLTEAIKVARRCVSLGKKYEDTVFYVNSLINYASILYSYGLACNYIKRRIVLHRVERQYKAVMREAIGVSIEAEANALWGLGCIECYYKKYKEALILFYDALDLLYKIGNKYAIIQLENIISETEKDAMKNSPTT